MFQSNVSEIDFHGFSGVELETDFSAADSIFVIIGQVNGEVGWVGVQVTLRPSHHELFIINNFTAVHHAGVVAKATGFVD